MATIRSRGKNRWQVQAYTGRHPTTGRRTFTARTITGTRTDATRAATALQAEVDAGKVRPSDDLTVTELLTRWIAHRSPGWSPKYLTEVEGITRRHTTPIAGIKVARLRPADLDGLYTHLVSNGVGRPTVATLHRRLHAALNAAVRWDLIATNPAERAQPPAVPRSRARAATPDQAAAALTGLDTFMAAWVRLSAVTGARRGEVAGLQWTDIDLDAGTVLFARAVVDPGKGRPLAVKSVKEDRPKRPALDAGTVQLLRSWRAECAAADLTHGTRSPWVFPSDKDRSQPIRPGVVSKRWERLNTGVRLHDLRHGVGTGGMEEGFTPMEVAARLGHARASTTTDLYGHTSPARDRQLADALGRRLDQAIERAEG